LLQSIGGLVDTTVILVEIGLGGNGGVGDQAVGQLGSLVQLIDGRTEHLVLTHIPSRRVEAVDPSGKTSESGLIGPHLPDIIGGKDVVTQESVVAIQERLHSLALYAAHRTNVLGFG
jgi:hypothetical protein